jgi:excisionase family DNA binding protein
VRSFDQEKPLAVTVTRARALTGLGHSTIYRLLGDGTLESCRVGKRRLIRYESIERLIAPGANFDTPENHDGRKRRRAKAG